MRIFVLLHRALYSTSMRYFNGGCSSVSYCEREQGGISEAVSIGAHPLRSAKGLTPKEDRLFLFRI